jgi:hypothetical protein
MAEEVKIKAPKRWWSGPSRREHDFLSEVLRLAQNGKNLEEIQSQISGRVSLLRELENKYDWSTVVGWALGLFGGMGLILGLLSESIRDMGFFMFLLSVFHFWEWFYASWFQPEQVNVHCASQLCPNIHNSALPCHYAFHRTQYSNSVDGDAPILQDVSDSASQVF